jgi:hypothetical protein
MGSLDRTWTLFNLGFGQGLSDHGEQDEPGPLAPPFDGLQRASRENF